MAHLWMEGDEGAWLTCGLTEGTTYAVKTEGVEPVSDMLSNGRGAVLLAHQGSSQTQWVLVAGPGSRVRVNGRDTELGICTLEERDELLVANTSGTGRRYFFATQAASHVEPFPASQASARCPRCRQSLVAGQPAVRCPSCGLWHHQTEVLPCWQYAPACAGCPQITDLNAGYPWTPELL